MRFASPQYGAHVEVETGTGPAGRKSLVLIYVLPGNEMRHVKVKRTRIIAITNQGSGGAVLLSEQNSEVLQNPVEHEQARPSVSSAHDDRRDPGTRARFHPQFRPVHSAVPSSSSANERQVDTLGTSRA